jgi:hypothetical protein
LLRSRKRNQLYVRNVLIGALSKNPPPRLTEVASHMGYKNTVWLHKKYPQLCQEISENYNRFTREQGKTPFPKVRYDLWSIKQSLIIILKQDCPPPIRQIARDLNICDASLRIRFHEICREIKARRKESKIKKLLDVENDMRNALKENPPPSLKAVLKRNGIGHKKLVFKSLPELCVAISIRFTKWKKTQKTNVKLNLQAALSEDAPVSLIGITKRYGYCLPSLYRLYPELCHRISTRFRNYQKACRKRKRELVKQSVKKIAIDLCNEGLYPSQEQVTPLLETEYQRNWLIIGQALREFRDEMNIKYR